jgi:serine phosphatase RsbU (regulator of sigma subunit)
MSNSTNEMPEGSPTFRRALLKSEKKRIIAVIGFVAFFAVLAIIRIFALGSAMSRWGLVAAALVIAFELWLLHAVNKALQSNEDVPSSAWYLATALESLFPAVGVASFVSTRLVPEYRPLATPWAVAFFPLVLLSVLRLSPRLCWFSGIVSAVAYLAAAYASGWRYAPGPNGFAATQTAVAYFGLLLLFTGILAGVVAAEIRAHVDSALREAETRHQLEQVEHELQIARAIQESLLPKVQPQIAGFKVAGWSRTATDTGGDFYDWQRLPDGRWVMVLADVTGHGIGPAILAAVCRAYSRASFNSRDNLETMIKNINQSFAADLTPERFATFVAALCQEGGEELELLSAGHGPILVYASDTKLLSLLEAQALPLGIFPDLWDALPIKLRMQPGDIVILITDGFLEWQNKDGEAFGTDRLAAVVQQFSDREPAVIIAELYHSVLKFAAGTPQQDDLTAVLIKRSPPEVLGDQPPDPKRLVSPS